MDWPIRKLLLSKQLFPWRNSIESGGGLPVYRSGYQRPHSIARGGGIPLYPADKARGAVPCASCTTEACRRRILLLWHVRRQWLGLTHPCFLVGLQCFPYVDPLSAGRLKDILK